MISSSELIKGYTEMIVLAILYNKDDYIYNISNSIYGISEGLLTITNPSLVIILKKMYDEGKVSTYNVLNEKNVNRKFYSITQFGREYYDSQIETYILSLEKIKLLIRRDR